MRRIYSSVVRRLNHKSEITNQGLTLIELLITVVLVSILLGAIWVVYDVGFRTFHTQMVRTSAKGEVGRLFINIAKELRQATSMTNAQQVTSTFTADTDYNGVDETIQYTWSGIAGEPLNRVLTSVVPSFTTTTPVVNSVSNLALSYYDVNNNLLSFPVTPSLVRLVAIDISVTDKEETFHLRSNIELRNL
mgnify:CR=1 FL=1